MSLAVKSLSWVCGTIFLRHLNAVVGILGNGSGVISIWGRIHPARKARTARYRDRMLSLSASLSPSHRPMWIFSILQTSKLFLDILALNPAFNYVMICPSNCYLKQRPGITSLPFSAHYFLDCVSSAQGQDSCKSKSLQLDSLL